MGAPNFASQVNPNDFKVQGEAEDTQKLNDASKSLDGISLDWTKTNAMLGQLGGAQAGADAQATGKDQMAGRAAELGQQNLGANDGSPASVGKALMQLGSKMSAQQAANTAGAQEQQVVGANDEAANLRKANQDIQMSMYQKELTLNNTKAQMQDSVKQMQNGMQIAAAQLRNMYNQSVARARNAKDLSDIQMQHDSFNQIMNYVGAGLQATSAATAAGAGLMAPSAADQALAQTYDAGSKAMSASWSPDTKALGADSTNQLSSFFRTGASGSPVDPTAGGSGVGTA
jgi:hypothetical protein